MIHLSCYDKFIRREVKEEDLCCSCSNYNGLVVKKKAQNAMGR
jgi:hypothetical protein